MAGAITNIVLDPIMIYGLLGCPQLGVKGAAYATVIGQIVSMTVGLIFHIKLNKEVTNGIKYLKPSAKIIGRIYSIGLPAIIAQALMSVMNYGMNIILNTVSAGCVTAYGLYYKIQQFFLFAAFGMRDAITPVISFAHGMGSKKRITDGIKYGMIFTLVIMAAGMIIIECLAYPLAGIFSLSGETLDLCIEAMRIVSLSFVFAGANIAFQGIFQAVDSGMPSLIVSVCRQLLFVLPVAWGFALLVTGGAVGTWILWTTFIIAEGVSALISVLFMVRIYKKKIA